MSDQTTLTLELDARLEARLRALARETGRSVADLAAEAIEAYLDYDAWKVETVRQAVEQADAGGPFVAHEEVVRWVESWGSEEELPKPKGALKEPAGPK